MVDNVAIVGANVKSPDGSWQMPIRKPDGEFLSPEEIDKLGLISYEEFHGGCALFDVEKCNALGWYDESFTIYMNELDLATRAINAGHLVLFRSDAVAIHIGVGDKNACNIRAYYFIRNYNTVLTRNFRSFIGRVKAVTLHTFMSGGYFAERILIHNTCKNRLKIFSFGYLMIKAYTIALYRCIKPDKRNRWLTQSVFEQAMYNGFKRCISDRAQWIKGKQSTTTKGVR
jgi:GT2 family glycosyltransferase